MHVSQLTHDPNPDGTCRACRSPIHPETWLCMRCGAAHGEKNRCPHCRTISRTLPHPTLLHRCSVCGKSRFPAGPSTHLAAPESVAALKRASFSARSANVLTVLSYVLFASGFFSLFFMSLFLWVSSPGLTGLAVGLVFALLPWMLALYTRLSAKGAERNRDEALTFAYSEQVFAALRAAGREASTTQISEWLGLPVARTEHLLAKLNTDDRMTSNVTDDGELVYGVIQPQLRVASPNLRVELSGASSDSSADIVNAELEESDEDASQQHRRS